MIRKRAAAAVVGVGAACAACCTAPVAGFIAAIGLGTVGGALLFGLGGLVIAAISVGLVVVARRRRFSRGVELIPMQPAEAGRRSPAAGTTSGPRQHERSPT